MSYMDSFIEEYKWLNNKEEFDLDYIGVIYKATSITDGKSYIGQTIKLLEDRIVGHLRSIKNPEKYKPFYFQRALITHGIENFIWEIVDTFNSKEECKYKEKQWVWNCGTYALENKYGYNLTEGGEWGDTMTNHPDKERLRKQNSENQKNSPNKPRGVDHHFYGKNDHSFGLVNHAKERAGKTNEEFYGREKADLMVSDRLKTREKNKHTYVYADTEIKISNEFMDFFLSYAKYDTSFQSIVTLAKFFVSGKRSQHVIIRQLKKHKLEEYKKLNSMMRSRQTSGEKNGRYHKEVSTKTRESIGNGNRGKGRKDHKIYININELVNQFFDTQCDIEKMSKHFNVDTSIIYLRLRLTKLKPIRRTNTRKKALFFSTHTREEFYV